MSYNTLARMAEDAQLTRRVAAAAATQQIANPPLWAASYMWRLAASPSWDEAYASAVAAGKQNIGGDESVITDGMILSAVQPLARSNPAPGERVTRPV